MRRENGKAGTRRLVLVRSTESPEGNGTTTELGKPALQFRLRRIMGQTAQVQHLAAFRQESTDIRPGIHGASHDLGVFMRRLGLADQSSEHSSQSDGLLHGPSRRSGGQSLQMEGEVVLDGGGGLDGFDFEGGADVGERAGAERQRLGVVSLPSLIFGAQIEGARVLEVRGEDDRLVSGLTRQLHPKIPRIQRHEGKLQVLADEVFLGEGVKAGDGIAESTCRADVLPCQSCQARCRRPSAIEPADRYIRGGGRGVYSGWGQARIRGTGINGLKEDSEQRRLVGWAKEKEKGSGSIGMWKCTYCREA